ncbi:hypothetical protein ACFXJ8_20480 [Nonomuraea sp. NPDC059194]|uniref:hypothetical protein n=1 Tax=Nonomuraea sp. NPDC059194 TaxID=3346764 RepID=UPI00369D6B4E
MSVMALATYLLVEGAQGNEEAIRQAKTSWINALGGTLGLEGQILPGIQTVREAMAVGWDTDDQLAFKIALNAFNSQLGALKTSVEYMGEGLGHLADAYADFDTALRLMGASLIIALTGLMIARVFPATAAAAMFSEAAAAKSANIAVIAVILQLEGFVANMAFNLRDLRSALLNIKTVLPAGGGAISFKAAEINTQGLPPFQPPPERGPGQRRQLPAGSEDFDWELEDS